MDFKKVKLFAYGVLISVLLFVIGVLGVKFLGDYYLDKFSIDKASDYQKILIIRWVIVIFFSVTLFISYISLLIQTCRIDESSESHFYIVMAMLSVIPLCALTLIVRTAHLQILERNKKIKMLAESLNESNDIIETKENYSEGISEETDKIYEPNNELQEKSYSNDLFVEDEKFLNEIKNFENDNNSLNDWKDEDFLFDQTNNVEEKNDLLEPIRTNTFNRDKYLSLKGTIYSKEKKYGKRKISNDKWEELENLVSQLELFQIDEETFYSKKDELLSK